MNPKLKAAYERGNFGLFIGSGLSQGSGLPGWKQLLEEMIDLAEENSQISYEKGTELKGLLENSNRFLLVAEELKEILGADLAKFVRNKFDNTALVPSSTLRKATNLRSKFIITTNYDTLIEKAFVLDGKVPNDLTYKDAPSINDNLLEGRMFILKAHGDARRVPNEIVITEKDYRNIIYKEPAYQSVLQSLFSMCNILFIGCSLDDPELKLLLGYIQTIFHGGSPDHFALISSADISETEITRWRKDFKVNVIKYDQADGHAELESIIDELLAIAL